MITSGVAEQIDEEDQELIKPFSEFKLEEKVVTALLGMGYSSPTKIQAKTLQHSLSDGDMACLSETGSGKTLSFLLPIVNKLVKSFDGEEKNAPVHKPK